MRDFAAFVTRQITPLKLPPEHEQKIVQEWAAQLEDVYDALRARGLSDSEAWLEVERQVPDWSVLADELLEAEPAFVRAVSGRHRIPWRATIHRTHARLREWSTAGLARDLRNSLRLLVRTPGFSATTVLTLGVCLGANVAIFAVVDAVLLRPLSVPESERIVGMGDVYPTITPNDILSNDVPSYFDRLEALTTLEQQGMFRFWYDTLIIDGIPQELRGMRATPSLFRVLQMAPVLGRAFTDAEGEIGSDQKIILSYELWQRLYGANPSVLGQSLRLGWTGKPYTIVGVMPRGFSFFDPIADGHVGRSQSVQFWIPLTFTPGQKSVDGRTRYGFFHIGRLRRDATVEQVQYQLDALHAEVVKRFPQFSYEELGMYTAATPLQEAVTRPVRRTLYLLWGGAAFVLLIGAINVTNLSLARASSRQRELATRLALGAARFHVARQLMIEALLPAMLGGAAGVVVADAILRWLISSGLADLPSAVPIGVSWSAVGYVTVVSIAAGLLIGVSPAMTVPLTSFTSALGEGNRSSTSGRMTRVFRRTLVVTQVALSVVLLVAATLLLTSFRHLIRLDAGFNPTNVVTATIFPPPSRYPDARAFANLFDRVLERLRTTPGIQAAGITSNIALSGFESPSTVSRERSAPADATVVPSVVAITPGYFETMSTPLMRGRFFAASDRAETLPVAIVDEPLAARLWPGEDPIGKTIYRGEAGPFTIVGVVHDVRLEGLARSIDSIGAAYFPHTQAPPLGRLRWIAIKFSIDPASAVGALRTVLREIDPDLPISDVQTMSERTAGSLTSQRLAARLATMFAGVALFLSMLGIYGVLTHLVALRTREIGIRLALGSTVRGIFRLVLAEGAVLIATGVAVGAAGAIATARLLKGLVFGVQPTDPRVLVAVATVTGCIALLASVVPARRATRVSPVEVLSDAQ
jgi:predicted permease